MRKRRRKNRKTRKTRKSSKRRRTRRKRRKRKRRFPKNPRKGQRKTILVNGRRVTFEATGKKGFGAWKIVSSR